MNELTAPTRDRSGLLLRWKKRARRILQSPGPAPLAPILGTGLALLAWVGCSRPSAPAPTENNPAEPSANAAPAATPPFTALIPKVGGPPGYVGSEACRECHPDEFSSWHQSFHRTMTQVPAADRVRANFNHVVLTNEDTRFVLTRTNDEFWVRMERPVQQPDGQGMTTSLDTRIGLVTGSHHMQVFWVPTGDGNAQIGFPFTWLIPEQRWVPRKSTFIRPPDSPHRSEIWNFTCSRCHTTGVEPRIDQVHHSAQTQVGELGIACEACHGPGERHTQARLARRQETSVDPATLRAEIVHPKKIDPVRAAQVCGFCHSMKWFDHAENWRERGFRYRPGDDLEETTPIIRPQRAESIPGLAPHLERNPELLRDFFWSDGMVRVSGRDYNGLLESPCYAGGKFSCLSCHSLHGGPPDGLLASNRTGDAACTQCHADYTDPAKRLAHTRHRADSSGSECYNCHMPRTTYGVLKAIRSHQVSSPKVADELRTGRPNACNLCHLDRSLAWTAGHLTPWFGHAPPQLSPKQAGLPAGARLALTGDAGARALAAWHLGWLPARQASGESWIAPVLLQLLDDPYAAVRCIAERSLRQSSTLVPTDYDYSVELDQRPAVASRLVRQWAAENPIALGAEPLVQLRGPGDAAGLHEQLDRLQSERDNRPVRLRE